MLFVSFFLNVRLFRRRQSATTNVVANSRFFALKTCRASPASSRSRGRGDAASCVCVHAGARGGGAGRGARPALQRFGKELSACGRCRWCAPSHVRRSARTLDLPVPSETSETLRFPCSCRPLCDRLRGRAPGGMRGVLRIQEGTRVQYAHEGPGGMARSAAPPRNAAATHLPPLF